MYGLKGLGMQLREKVLINFYCSTSMLEGKIEEGKGHIEVKISK